MKGKRKEGVKTKKEKKGEERGGGERVKNQLRGRIMTKPDKISFRKGRDGRI